MVNTSVVNQGTFASADRLLNAAMSLFAENGFAATSVGDIERAAGFAPRSGVLYKYFDSKRALLDAGLERHLAAVSDIDDEISLRPLGDVRSEITMLAWWLLAELDASREITHVVEREGPNLVEIRDRMRAGISDRGYELGVAMLQRWTSAPTEVQLQAFSVVAIGALINTRRSTWTFGATPLGLTDDQIVTTWVDMCLASIEALGTHKS